MSDLHQAVTAAVREHTPAVVPPFAEVVRLKRRRDRRRAALSMTCAVLAALVVAGSTSWSGGRSPGPSPQVAEGAPALAGEPVRYEVRGDAAAATEDRSFGEGLDRCLELPGTWAPVADFSFPGGYDVTVVDDEAAAAFTACIAEVPGYSVTRSDRGLRTPLLPAPLDADGASICTERCVRVDAREARVLAVALLNAEPATPDVSGCAVAGLTYLVVFERRGRESAGIRVPTICGQVEVGGGRFALPAVAVDAVVASFDGGGTRLDRQLACLGRITARAGDREVLIRPGAEVPLDVAVGEPVRVRADGPCGDAIGVSGNRFVEQVEGVLRATRPGELLVSVSYPQCLASPPAPVCYGGINSAGSLVLIAR